MRNIVFSGFMKRSFLFFALLAVFAACGDPEMKEEPKYTISGKIVDPVANGRRLLTGINAIVSGKSGEVVFNGPVSLSDTISCRYSLKDIPAGEYDLFFSGSYYDVSKYKLDVKGDTNLDVELSPIQLISIDTDKLVFGSRVNTREFSITNVCGRDLVLTIRTGFGAGRFVRNVTPGVPQDYGWLLILSAGETRHIKVEVLHDLEGVEEGSLEIWARDSQDWVEMSIPVIMETTSRDFHANLVGKVCDTQGKPLKDIMVYCECTGTVAMTDENGIYGFDELPYRSTFRVTALSERYKYKDSDFIDYVIDEIRADFTLEPCTNHLILDRKEVDFGSGSISLADMYNPESITINITAETDEPVYFNLQVFNTEFGTVPGLLYFPTAQYIEYYPQITFQLSRSVSDIGTFRLNALLKTDTAGSYIIPISFTNTP